MKITEDCINHNVVRIIEDIIQEPCDYENESLTVLAILAEVRGVLYLADELKEVLKG